MTPPRSRPADALYLTPGQVAEIFHVHPRTVRTWARKGLIPWIKTPGGHRRFPKAAIHALVGKDLEDAGQS